MPRLRLPLSVPLSSMPKLLASRLKPMLRLRIRDEVVASNNKGVVKLSQIRVKMLLNLKLNTHPSSVNYLKKTQMMRSMSCLSRTQETS